MIGKTPKDQPLKSVPMPTLHIPSNNPRYSFFLITVIHVVTTK